jgi:hypothetical protein
VNGPAQEAEQLIDTLAVRFGPKWTWSEIAAWTLARARTNLPRWQIQWARDFQAWRAEQEARTGD